MFVGITGADLFSGTNNWTYRDGHWNAKEGGVGIVSYHMLLAKYHEEPREIRRRLIDRMTKVLIATSLKLLDLPDATDPSDPYSYAEGVNGLDVQSLELSQPTKDALDKLR